jgi:hypothetical protein
VSAEARDATRDAIVEQLRRAEENVALHEQRLIEALAAKRRLTTALEALERIRDDLAGKPVKPSLGAEVRERILAVVASGQHQGGWRGSQVCERLGVADAEVIRRQMRDMAGEGVLAKDANRRYRLPPQARADKAAT